MANLVLTIGYLRGVLYLHVPLHLRGLALSSLKVLQLLLTQSFELGYFFLLILALGTSVRIRILSTSWSVLLLNLERPVGLLVLLCLPF